MTDSKPHSELAEALDRAHDSWAGGPLPVGPGISEGFRQAAQDRRTLAAEVTRLEEQLEAALSALEHIGHPNYGARATGQDARDMASVAHAALARIRQEAT